MTYSVAAPADAAAHCVVAIAAANSAASSAAARVVVTLDKREVPA